MESKVNRIRESIILVLGGLMFGCVPPSIPDYDIADGKLIFKDTCQGHTIYLMDIVILNAYKSGYNYSDTLTIGDTTYFHVVRLDEKQSDFLSKKNLYSKINIDFIRGTRNDLPICNGLPSKSVETVNVLDIRSTDYR